MFGMLAGPTTKTSQRTCDAMIIGRGPSARSHNEIETRRELATLSAVGFADQSFPMIANNSIPRLLWDADSESPRKLLRRTAIDALGDNTVNHQHIVSRVSTLANDKGEIAGITDPLSFGKTLVHVKKRDLREQVVDSALQAAAAPPRPLQ